MILFLTVSAYGSAFSHATPASPSLIAHAETTELQDDFSYYQKYGLFLKYEKKQKYAKYKKYQKNKKKYGFNSTAEKKRAKDGYAKYKLYKKDSRRYAAYAVFQKDHKRYASYKDKVGDLSKYAKYSKYKKYDKSAYNEGKNYRTVEYKAGYDRYIAAQAKLAKEFGEADLGCGAKDGSGACLGPDISVGLWCYSSAGTNNTAYDFPVKKVAGKDECYLKNQLKTAPLRVSASEQFVAKDKNGTVLASFSATDEASVAYLTDGTFRVSAAATTFDVTGEVRFAEADADNDIVFTTKPRNKFATYRGALSVRYSDQSKWVWVINTLPMEQYVWGMGEITGDGHDEHDKVMTTVFRTYGYWRLKFSTKYATEGFKVNATSGNQVYYGYAWETGHKDIRDAAEKTRGRIVMHYSGAAAKNEIALTPYSSWTDGRTRSFEERWGSTDYPWCRSVDDPYGKNTTSSNPAVAKMTTQQLEAAGNHMVGLSAHGSLRLATDHSWKWDTILKYYFKDINLLEAY